MYDATLMVKKLRFVTVKLTECMKGVCAFPQPLKACNSFLITFDFKLDYAMIKVNVIFTYYVVLAHFLKYMEIEFPYISYYCFVSFSNYYGIQFLKIPNGISSFISDLHAFLC